MASPAFAIRRIRKAQQQLARPSQGDVNPRADYKEILEAVYRSADEETHDDLMGWIIVETIHDGKLPHPEELRDRARELCLYRDITISDDSPLQP